MSFDQPSHPLRAKIIFVWLVLILLANLVVLIMIEKLSIIKALYFIIITISTVGYGDIVPDYDITRIFIVMLIISFLGFIATFSENIISRVIRTNQENQYRLTENLDLKDHIIIIGSHKIAKNLAELVYHRVLPVVYLSSNKHDIDIIKQLGIEGYILEGDPFPRLNVIKAKAMFLALNDDEQTIKFSVQVRPLNANMQIYALTKDHMKKDYFKFLNMNHSFTNERILGKYISHSTTRANILPFPKQENLKSKYFIFDVSSEQEARLKFNNFRILPILQSQLQTLNDPLSTIAVPREEGIQLIEDLNLYDADTGASDSLDTHFSRVIIGGYNQFVKEVLETINLPLDNIAVFTFNEVEKDLAEQDNLQVDFMDEDLFPQFVVNKIGNNDLIINFFSKLSDSLYTNSVLIEADKEVETIQVIYENFEREIFEKMGVKQMVLPYLNTTRSMMNTLIKKLQIPYSLISSNMHLFEMVINKSNPYCKKSTRDLINDGYEILFIKKSNGIEFEIDPSVQIIIEEGDSLFVKKQRLI